ncbi:MAG: copper resistance system multicopper oxidase, partial [Caulobacteraceae bacterium]
MGLQAANGSLSGYPVGVFRSSMIRPSRRSFAQGLALAGGACALARPVWTRAAGLNPAVLRGPSVDLDIADAPVKVTGRRRTATLAGGRMPGPTLVLREGETVTIRVTNRLAEPTSIHWHGFRLPNDMDGVPGLTFAGIAPGETFAYRFPIVQGGTYFYHSHSGMQEQTGLYGAALLIPRAPEPYAYDRDYVVVLSDWTDEDPMEVLANLKQQGDYYDRHRPTLAGLAREAREKGLGGALSRRWMWARMRMSPTDIADVTGATYTFLVNGLPPEAGWTALFKPGERVRLRFVNAASMTAFDVRIPGLPLTVVAADGNDVEPVAVDEFRIGVAETYDAVVTPRAEAAYAIFAQAEDRSGYALGVLASRPGLRPEVPKLDPRPVRTMADMGMGGAMVGMNMGGMGMADMPGMGMPGMKGMAAPPPAPIVVNADGIDPKRLKGQPFVDNVAAAPRDRLAEAGDGLDGDGRKALTYADLRALHPDPDSRPPDRELVFHLTGNMERWVWGFDGLKFSKAEPVRVRLGERVRFTLINDTMMEHPIHLHGFLFSLENGQAGALPLKHTVNVKPGGKLSFVFTADTPGRWAFHCHLLYHMESGMFRTVLVA